MFGWLGKLIELLSKKEKKYLAPEPASDFLDNDKEEKEEKKVFLCPECGTKGACYGTYDENTRAPASYFDYVFICNNGHRTEKTKCSGADGFWDNGTICPFCDRGESSHFKPPKSGND